MKIKVPLRLDIAGSCTDLPGYREKGGAHINVPLAYYAQISYVPFRTGNGNVLRHVLTQDESETHYPFAALEGRPFASLEGRRLDESNAQKNEFIERMNGLVAMQLNVPRVELTATCDLEHGSGLGASSATVVGIVKYYSEVFNLRLQPEAIARFAGKAIEQTGICGRQDEFSAAFAQPLYLRYKNDLTIVNTFELPDEFRQKIEAWKMMYIPRTIPCQEMLEYEISQNFEIAPIKYFTDLMFMAIYHKDWENFYKFYLEHWKFVEKQNPYKINDAIRAIRQQYDGIYIRPCGAGAGGYLLFHGDVQGENMIEVKLCTNKKC